ncbi:MAG: DinB family protein [Tepidiformaceae bacterium]
MVTDVDVTRGMLVGARRMFSANTKSLSLDEALFAGGGYRSILGVVKHIGGWVHVYRSYAFDTQPRHWAQTAWPRGLIDTVEPTKEYFDEVVAWTDAGLKAWDRDLASVEAGTLDQPRPMHWGGTMPLATIVGIIAHHVVYHTGELNMLLSISRGEAWEHTEEVEENHISTYGHGTRAPWMNDAQNDAHDEKLRLAHEARMAGKK